jgi:hypothetical protein
MPKTEHRCLLEGSLLEAMADHEGMAAKKAKTEPKWKEDHITYFREAGIPWPPKDIPANEGMSERMNEIIYFADQTEPLVDDDDNDGAEPREQFADLNRSLKYLKKGTGEKVFSKKVPSLLATSIIWARRAEKKANGLHHMAWQGWDLHMYAGAESLTQVTNPRLRELAGNAFNGFTLVPILIGICSAMADIFVASKKPHTVSTPATTPSVVDVISSDSSNDGSSGDSDSSDSSSSSD